MKQIIEPFIKEDNFAKISGYYQNKQSIPKELSIPKKLSGRSVTEIDGFIWKIDTVYDDS